MFGFLGMPGAGIALLPVGLRPCPSSASGFRGYSMPLFRRQPVCACAAALLTTKLAQGNGGRIFGIADNAVFDDLASGNIDDQLCELVRIAWPLA
jgi:hypothetical protein